MKAPWDYSNLLPQNVIDWVSGRGKGKRRKGQEVGGAGYPWQGEPQYKCFCCFSRRSSLVLRQDGPIRFLSGRRTVRRSTRLSGSSLRARTPRPRARRHRCQHSSGSATVCARRGRRGRRRRCSGCTSLRRARRSSTRTCATSAPSSRRPRASARAYRVCSRGRRRSISRTGMHARSCASSTRRAAPAAHAAPPRSWRASRAAPRRRRRASNACVRWR